MKGSVRSDSDLYYEEVGQGVPILLIHPAGATASTWGSATEELARIGRVGRVERACDQALSCRRVGEI